MQLWHQSDGAPRASDPGLADRRSSRCTRGTSRHAAGPLDRRARPRGGRAGLAFMKRQPARGDPRRGVRPRAAGSRTTADAYDAIAAFAGRHRLEPDRGRRRARGGGDRSRPPWRAWAAVMASLTALAAQSPSAISLARFDLTCREALAVDDLVGLVDRGQQRRPGRRCARRARRPRTALRRGAGVRRPRGVLSAAGQRRAREQAEDLSSSRAQDPAATSRSSSGSRRPCRAARRGPGRRAPSPRPGERARPAPGPSGGGPSACTLARAQRPLALDHLDVRRRAPARPAARRRGRRRGRSCWCSLPDSSSSSRSSRSSAISSRHGSRR